MADLSATTTTRDGGAATLLGDPASSSPLIICFHGSGDSCRSWIPLAELLSASYRVLLWDRRQQNISPDAAVRDMLEYLDQAQLKPPYIPVAHSYGGTFARLFLHKRPGAVAGMVLVETGQETELGDGIEQRQYRKQVLGDKPLVVIRGNTLMAKWAEYERELAAAEAARDDGNDGTTRSGLAIKKQLLDATDQEDERLKKAQLALSRRHQYVHIPDCGHDVVQRRPEAVVDAVRWVMENLKAAGGQRTGGPKGILNWLRRFWQRA